MQRIVWSATTTTDTDALIELPTDFLEMREIHFQGNPPITLYYQTPDKFFRNLQTTTSGIPYYYTIIGNEFQFAPEPDSTKTVQMLYYAQPDYISSTKSTNIYLNNFSDALLYATLAEAEPYLMNDIRIQTWASMYDRAITNIMSSDIGTKYPNTSLNVTVG